MPILGNPSLVPACEPGAREYDGVVIAAFADPSVDERVVCWADGSVAKSPPPNASGEVQPPYDRLVFTVMSDGTTFRFLRAGYRTTMKVEEP